MKFAHVLLAAVILSAPAVHAADVPTSACVAHAAASLDALTHGDYAGARKDFSDAVASKLNADRLEQAWQRLQSLQGAYRSHDAPRVAVFAGHPVVLATLNFAKARLDFMVACDAQDKIIGYRFVPPETPVQAHVEADGVRVSPLDVPTPVGPLRGVLTMPPGTGPFPAVVMVAGSGAHDMDETVGPNKPFRDIAERLARAGVASLRYDKRTFDHPKDWGGKSGPVIDAEVTDDAVAAARLLARQETVDPRRVFVLGHSLGAMMAPRIGEHDPQLAGLVLMAAPARRIFDVLEQQVREQTAKVDNQSAAIAQAVQPYVEEQKLLAAVGPGQPAPQGDFKGVPQGYWLSWSRVDPVADARALSTPMLILQGNDDFQVSSTLDFAHWRKELAGRPHTTFHLYPGLSHLFMPAGKTGTLADYKAPAHVDAEVIDDIASWVKAQPAR
ncbi:alpha/beta fold hydrolase [Rhodanobacter geophilus]|uniref:Alpha/beta fold hydrolase n=1 Tax=Rhodanobacter geophilus TaxID=3162488 RepID=A0ABV3QMR7_9GAMM